MLTAETITDVQIKALRDEALVGGYVTNDRHEIIRLTNAALGGGRESTRAYGRAQLAKILNARAKTNQKYAAACTAETVINARKDRP